MTGSIGCISIIILNNIGNVTYLKNIYISISVRSHFKREYIIIQRLVLHLYQYQISISSARYAILSVVMPLLRSVLMKILE